MLGIAQTAQDGGRIVIQHRGRNADEDDADVGHRVLEQLVRGVNKLQQRPGDQGRDDSERHTHRHTERRAIEQVLVQVIAVLGTEALGHRDAKADTGTLGKAQDQKVQRIGGAHRAQCVSAKAPAHNDSVRKAVQLLEQGAQHQRQGKFQDAGQRPAHRKVGGAGALLGFFHGIYMLPPGSDFFKHTMESPCIVRLFL